MVGFVSNTHTHTHTHAQRIYVVINNPKRMNNLIVDRLHHIEKASLQKTVRQIEQLKMHFEFTELHLRSYCTTKKSMWALVVALHAKCIHKTCTALKIYIADTAVTKLCLFCNYTKKAVIKK